MKILNQNVSQTDHHFSKTSENILQLGSIVMMANKPLSVIKSTPDHENIRDGSVRANRETSNDKHYQITCSDQEIEDASQICSPKSYDFNIDDSD